jgi:peptidyl-prolyl cis-trans isomerase B (cyclophilin B)
MKCLFSIAVVFLLISKPDLLPAQAKKKTPAPAPRTAESTGVKKPPSTLATDTSKRVKITTSFGEIVIRLSDKTPLHRDNFIKLVKERFYDSLLFHRVIGGFMIQGGDPNSKYAPAGQQLGSGDVGYTIPAEFDTTLFHKKGALCAARTDNPAKASSGCQFYIVEGRPLTDGELDNLSSRMGIYFSPAKRMTYKMKGGTPFLDMGYTVFGEVVSGIEVVEKIAHVQKDGSDRPVADIRMQMELL